MSIQWSIIAGFLYAEIGIVIALLLPIATPKMWSEFFRSRLFSIFKRHASMYFCVVLGILSLFMFDSIREIRKYTPSSDSSHINLSSDMKHSIKLFRAQRNFYITGFAIFLSFVIRRLIYMIIVQAELLNKSEMIIKEAEDVKNKAKAAITESELNKTQLDICESFLHEEKAKVVKLTSEVEEWKLKYEELTLKAAGKGDE